MKGIYLQYDFLSSAECFAVMSFYEANKDKTFLHEYNQSYPLQLHHFEGFHEFDYIHSRVVDYAEVLSKSNFEVHNFEIVKWGPKSKMKPHKDFSVDEWSAIVYLNDNYYGGKTRFTDQELEITPKQGTLVLFNGHAMRHSVSEILNGNRYTMAYWLENESV